MVRIILTSLYLFIFTVCIAQGDTSLTQDFSRRSAKERTRIALQEQEASLQDANFQALMAEAETLFKQRKYDEALAKFKEARKARPYNVHPKVKIHDLEVFIRKRDEALAEDAKETQEPVKTVVPEIVIETLDMPPVTQLPSAIGHVTPDRDLVPVIDGRTEIQVPTATTIHTTKEISPPPPPKGSIHREREIKEPMIRTIAEVTIPPTVLPPPDHDLVVGESVFKEAGSVVLERIIEEEGRMAIYRKVTQPWGHQIHFKDGVAITVHAWEVVFGDQ